MRITSFILTSLAAAELSRRDVIYGYEDCSEAPKSAKNMEGCGIPVPEFSCDDISVAIESCVSKCEAQNECEFISVVQDEDVCRCSLRTRESLMKSTLVVDEQPDRQGRLYCDEEVMQSLEIPLRKNCNGEDGCVYNREGGMTIAMDGNMWAYIDACQEPSQVVKVPELKSKAERQASEGPKVKLIEDPELLFNYLKNKPKTLKKGKKPCDNKVEVEAELVAELVVDDSNCGDC